MKKLLASISVLLVPVIILAQDLDYAKSIIKKLASSEFKGRGYVENGNGIAAKFISSEYATIGLEAFQKNYFQPFKIDVNTFPNNLFFKVDKDLMEPGKDYLIDPMSPSVKGTFDTYLIKKQDLLTEQKVKEAIQNSRNKLLVIDERGYSSDNKEEIKKINELINFLKYNPQLPTAGTILLTSEKLTWSVSSMQASKPILTLKKDQDFQMGNKVELKVDAKFIKNYKTQNIIGYIRGQEVPDSFLVVTAHYDHLGKMGKSVYIPGANDNASGVAMLLNLAKYFKENPPKYSMAFICLGAEELGILGAKYYTEHPLFDLSAIKFLVNFDLAGTGDEGIKVVNATVHKEAFAMLNDLNDANNYLASVQSRGPACNSDHCMFHEKQVPCFYIYTLGGIQAYHDIYDRYETLPLTEFEDYSTLMIDFFKSF
nr:M28 family peptidase [uncultured Carboxylicivirga sp.]